MENWMKHSSLRAIFPRAAQENRADLGGDRDKKIPVQKTQSFKDKKSQNWLQMQFSRKMSRDYDSPEIEQAVAIAAAAFAISSQEFSKLKISEGPESSSTKTKTKPGGITSLGSQTRPSSKILTGSFKSSDGQGSKVPVTDEKKPEKALTPASSFKKTPTSREQLNTDDTKPEIPAPRKTPTFGKNTDDVLAPKRIPAFGDKKTDESKPEIPQQKFAPPVQSASSRPIPPPSPPPQIGVTSIKPGPVRPPTPPVNTRRQTPTRLSTNDKKAEAWEREELEKIKYRYEKLKETIDSWENKKEAKARQKLNKKERSVSERKRARAYEKFQSEIQYIKGIADGARAQAAERRRNEELKVKEKANIIRTTGKLPGTCLCF